MKENQFEKAAEIINFSHGPEFLNEAINYLEQRGIKPDQGKNYYLRPGTEVYKSFLNFFASELENLPFNDEVGKTIKMRRDAKEVITRLTEYLRIKYDDISQLSKWDNKDLERIADIFNGNLEVFKNEIYPQHNIEGIGYNVDLSAVRYGDRYVPLGIILERRYVTIKNGFKVLDHGFLRLDLQSGLLSIDLEEFPTSNIHLGS